VFLVGTQVAVGKADTRSSTATPAAPADITVGAELPVLGAAVAVLLVIGGTLLVLSLVVIAMGLQHGSRRQRAS